MARGRRGAAGPPAATASGPGPAERGAELAAGICAGVDALVTKALTRALDGKEARDHAVAVPDGGGVAGRTAGSARDLLTLATWAHATGDLAQAKRLLERAQLHQARHIAWLESSTRTSLGVADGVLAGEQLAGARWLSEELARLAAQPDQLDLHGSRARVRKEFGESKQLADAAEADLSTLLRAGDHAGALDLAAAVWETAGDNERVRRAHSADAGDLARLARVALALEHLDPSAAAMRSHGRGIPPLLELVGPLSQERLAGWGSERLEGDAAERFTLKGASDGALGHHGADRAAPDADDALVLGRALLRRARRLRSRRRDSRRGVSVRVPVSPAALVELAGRHAGTPVEVLEELAEGKTTETRILAGLRRGAKAPEGPLEVIYTAYCATTRSADPAKRHAMAETQLAEEGLDPGRLAESVTPAPPRVGPASTRPGDPEIADPTMLLGPERCDHPKAKWRIDGHTYALTCTTCARGRIAAVPLHRTSQKIRNEERYLEHERFHAALRGDTRPITSVADLRLRDGLAPTAPSAYRVTADTRPAGRETSLAASFGRRRR